MKAGINTKNKFFYAMLKEARMFCKHSVSFHDFL